MLYTEQLEIYKQQLLKSINHLEFSYEKIKILPTNVLILSLDQLETWESFLARFARTSDIFFAKYLRTRILKDDPAFRGSFLDLLNIAAKLHLIDDTTIWMEIRALRNRQAHEYSEEQMTPVFQASLEQVYHLINLKNVL